MRNIVAIAAIAMTSVLFTTVFVMGIDTVERMQMETMRQSGGQAHVSVQYHNKTAYDTLKSYSLIEEIGLSMILADEVQNSKLDKRMTEFWYMDEVSTLLRFSEPTIGTMPREKKRNHCRY